MVGKVLYLMLISSLWCLIWCLPARDLPNNVYIVKDERQKGSDINVRLNIDGLVAAFPVPEDAISVSGGNMQIVESLWGALLDNVFSGNPHRTSPSPNEYVQPLIPENTVQVTESEKSPVTESEKNPETTTIDTSTNTVST